MPKIIVEVMPKAELLDPQGKAVAAAISRLGVAEINGVRVGKRFELAVTGEVTAELLSEVQKLADELLSNGVIEDVISVRAE